jgi:hypothetical protein
MTRESVDTAGSVLLVMALPVILFAWAPSALAQRGHAPATPPDLAGVYQAIPNHTTLPGGLKNEGFLADIALLPMSVERMKTVDLREDPAKMCQPIGPFRMMARDQTKIELVPVAGMIVVLFEDVSHGVMRTIHMNRTHSENLQLTHCTEDACDVLGRMGDSVGRWEADTLVVDTVGFKDQTWLNDQGAQHSDALHLIERIRPVVSGKYLEYRMTAEDPKVLARPYSYTRYYEETKAEIMEDVCEYEE